MARIRFMNTEIDNVTMEEALQALDDLILNKRSAFVVTPNVDHIVQLERGGELCEVYRKADLILADGKPLLWIAKWYGTPIKEKVSGSDLFPRLCQMAAQKGYTMFFLCAAAEEPGETEWRGYWRNGGYLHKVLLEVFALSWYFIRRVQRKAESKEDL